MKNADKALVPEQRVLLERLLRKHAGAFASGPTDLGRTSLMYHRIDIGDNNSVRQPMRRMPMPHEHIPVLKAEVDKLQKAGAVVPSTSPFASPTILVKKKTNRFTSALTTVNSTQLQRKTHINFPALKTYLTRLPDPSTIARWTWRWDIIKLKWILTIAIR